MATTVFHVNEQAFRATERGESFFDKYIKTFKEYQASIICGILSMNGNTNATSLYRMLAK